MGLLLFVLVLSFGNRFPDPPTVPVELTVPEIISDDVRTTYLPDDRIEIFYRRFRFTDGSDVTIESVHRLPVPWPEPDPSDWRAVQAWENWKTAQERAARWEAHEARREAVKAAWRRPGMVTRIGGR